ncbi:MAG: OmpA family protein, partial [Bacteroidia bacterium]
PVEVVAVTPLNEDSVAMAHEPIAIKKLIPIELSIYFDFDKFEIRPDAIARLDSVVRYMQASSKMTIVIDGHTDNVGTPEYNMVLSDKRDNAVIKYLYAKGVNPKRVLAKGYGLTKMVNRCGPGVICSDAEAQLNRRVEFHFTIEKTIIIEQ